MLPFKVQTTRHAVPDGSLAKKGVKIVCTDVSCSACCGTLGLTELPHSRTPLTMGHAPSWYGNTPVITRAKLVAAWAYLMASHKLRSEQIVLRAGGCGQLQQQASRAGQACHHLHTYVHLSMSMHCKGSHI